MMAPCKGCANAGCGSFHDQCEPYQSFLKANEELRNKKYTPYTISTEAELKRHCPVVFNRRKRK